MLLAILAVSCLVLTACQQPTGDQHTCEFGEWAVVEQATCTEAGLKVRVCECGESQIVIIPAGHSYTSVVTTPTCIEQGYTTHTCVFCGDNYVDAYVDICSKNGAHDFKCSNACEYCGQNIDDVAVFTYNMSSDVIGYIISRGDDKYDVFVKGSGDLGATGYLYTFYGDNLANVYIGNGITSIGEYAFYDWSGLTSITIPNSVTSIGQSAFSGCSSLTSIDIPEGVTSIGQSTFSGCSSLKSITIPASVTRIGDYAFSRCSSLTSVIFEDSNGWCAYGHWGDVELNLTDPIKNANYLTNTWCNTGWHKK